MIFRSSLVLIINSDKKKKNLFKDCSSCMRSLYRGEPFRLCKHTHMNGIPIKNIKWALSISAGGGNEAAVDLVSTIFTKCMLLFALPWTHTHTHTHRYTLISLNLPLLHRNRRAIALSLSFSWTRAASPTPTLSSSPTCREDMFLSKCIGNRRRMTIAFRLFSAFRNNM